MQKNSFRVLASAIGVVILALGLIYLSSFVPIESIGREAVKSARGLEDGIQSRQALAHSIDLDAHSSVSRKSRMMRGPNSLNPGLVDANEREPDVAAMGKEFSAPNAVLLLSRRTMVESQAKLPAQSSVPMPNTIRQIFIGDYLRKAFADAIYSGTALRPYKDPTLPAFFYGLGTPSSFAALKKHTGRAVVIFTGGDASIALTYATKSKEILEFVKRNSNRIMSISIANFIAKTLSEFKIRFVRMPFYPPGLIPPGSAVTKGNGVYTYGDVDSIYHHEVMTKHVRWLFPKLKFYFGAHCNPGYKPQAPWVCYSRKRLWEEIYPKCFIGIRLTQHDGLAATVQELGSLGIRSVWNGGTPSAIAWSTVTDVIHAIITESRTIGTKDEAMAMRVRQYLQLPQNFYETRTYFGGNVSV